MKVSYVTMLFPAPSEVFAGTDIRVLMEMQADVSVHSLRFAPRGFQSRLDEQGLSTVRLTFSSVVGNIRGLVQALMHPGLTCSLLIWICRRTGRRPGHLLRSIALLPRVLEVFHGLRRDAPDVVHLFWGHYPAMVGWLIARHCPDAVLSMFLGAYDLTATYGGSADVARSADVVWTHAAVNVPAIQALGVRSGRIRVAYRGIDTELMPRRVRPPLAGCRLVAVGRLIPEKAFADVLQAFAKILPTRPEASLTVLGDGPERRRLEGLAQRLGVAARTTFTGHVSHARVLTEFANSDVFLFLSRKDSERLPNVVKEAMACECLCVATRTPGMHELLEDQVHGFLVEPGDVHSAASLTTYVFQRPQAALHMVAHAKTHVETRFDARATMAVYLRTWKALRAGHNNADYVSNDVTGIVEPQPVIREGRAES